MNRDPIPPQPSRADALGQLRRERWHAVDAGETTRVAEIDREIERLSAAGTPTAPTRETTASTQPHAATAARTSPKPKQTKGQRRVAAR